MAVLGWISCKSSQLGDSPFTWPAEADDDYNDAADEDSAHGRSVGHQTPPSTRLAPLDVPMSQGVPSILDLPPGGPIFPEVVSMRSNLRERPLL